MVVGVTVDPPLPRGVAVGVDSDLLPPATAVGTADGRTSSCVDVASFGDGTTIRGGWAEAANSEVALAERNPSDRRRFIMGWPRPMPACDVVIMERPEPGWKVGIPAKVPATVLGAGAVVRGSAVPAAPTPLAANCWRKEERRDCSRRERVPPNTDEEGWGVTGPARDRADSLLLVLR